MHKTLAAALFALGLAGTAPAIAQKPVELTLSSWLPPTHAVVADFLMPWGEEIRKATDGRVTLRLLPKAVTNPAGHFDAVRDGLVDVTFVSHAYYPGRFQLTKFAVLPFSGDTATSRSIAAWDTYEKYLLKADEHKGVRLLGIYAHGPGIAFTTSKPVKQIGDFQGLKIRVGGGMAADVAKAVGASPIAKPAPESYELLSTGVADGVFFPAESLVSFKLDASSGTPPNSPAACIRTRTRSSSTATPSRACPSRTRTRWCACRAATWPSWPDAPGTRTTRPRARCSKAARSNWSRPTTR